MDFFLIQYPGIIFTKLCLHIGIYYLIAHINIILYLLYLFMRILNLFFFTFRNFVEIALVLTYYCGNAVYIVFITVSMTKVYNGVIIILFILILYNFLKMLK